MAHPAPTLEQALAKCAEDNDFTTVAIGRMPVGDRIVWTATVHWDGHSDNGICCQGGDSDTSIHEALYKAIEAAQAKRAPLAYVPLKLKSFDLEQAA